MTWKSFYRRTSFAPSRQPLYFAVLSLALVTMIITHSKPFISPSMAQLLRATDEWALLRLKATWAPKPPATSTLRSWVARTDCILWDGVFCDALGNVIRLLLPQFSLRGGLPWPIADLVNLKQLDLSSNFLSGPIPWQIGNLKMLTAIYLSRNSFNGSIPATVGNMTMLRALYLNNNRLSGGIPATLGNLKWIEDIRLNQNLLTGGIPAALGKLGPTLGYLDLSNNRLTGVLPPDIGNLTNLQALWASGNQFVGKIPTTFNYFRHLLMVNFSSNYLTGNLPNMSRNTRADTGYLDFSNNYFYGLTLFPVQGSPKCPSSKPTAFLMEKNCLVSASWCEAFGQRLPAGCKAFCGTLSNATDLVTSGQCSGNGYCVRDPVTNKSYCKCSLGFKPNPRNPQQCVKL